MCVLDNGKWVTTRKKHQCFGCLRKFPAGSELWRCVFTDGGSAYSIYTCAVCEAVYADWPGNEEYGEGDIRDADIETWEATRKELDEVPDA